MNVKSISIYKLPEIFCIEPFSKTEAGFRINENIVYSLNVNCPLQILGDTVIKAFNDCKFNIPTPSRDEIDKGLNSSELFKATKINSYRKLEKVALNIGICLDDKYTFSPMQHYKTGGYVGINGQEFFLTLSATPEAIGEAVHKAFALAK